MKGSTIPCVASASGRRIRACDCPDRPTSAQLGEKSESTFRIWWCSIRSTSCCRDGSQSESDPPASALCAGARRQTAGDPRHASKGVENTSRRRLGGVVDATFTLKELQENAPADRTNSTEPAEDRDADGPRVLVGKCVGGETLRLTSPDGWRYVFRRRRRAGRSHCGLWDADLSANDSRARWRQPNPCVETVRGLQQRGLIEKSRQRFRITPAGLEFRYRRAVPEPRRDAEAGTSCLPISSSDECAGR